MIRWTPARLASAISKIGPSLPGRSSVPRAIAYTCTSASEGCWDWRSGAGWPTTVPSSMMMPVVALSSVTSTKTWRSCSSARSSSTCRESLSSNEPSRTNSTQFGFGGNRHHRPGLDLLGLAALVERDALQGHIAIVHSHAVDRHLGIGDRLSHLRFALGDRIAEGLRTRL